jgi:hypothetical protein
MVSWEEVGELMVLSIFQQGARELEFGMLLCETLVIIYDNPKKHWDLSAFLMRI